MTMRSAWAEILSIVSALWLRMSHSRIAGCASETRGLEEEEGARFGDRRRL
jgi:hypothetical protein